MPVRTDDGKLMMHISEEEAALTLGARLDAMEGLHAYIKYTNKHYMPSAFSETVCAVLDQFVLDVIAGKRPVLILQAPPQHGKSEMVSRKLPAYLLGKYPDWRIGTASYSDELASDMGQHVRRNLASPEHARLFPVSTEKQKYAVNRIADFTSPGGSGSYLGVGVGAGLTGRSVDIGIIDDPTRDQKEALSQVTKENHWNWYQSVFSTRLSECSGQIIMATSWAEDDLPARIAELYQDDPRLKHLRFPAINLPDEVGYDPDLPEGALVPDLKSLEFLLEQKRGMSNYWWAALYQQRAKALGGNVFKDSGVQHWLPKDLPERFDKVIDSWDCTFKDTDGTDYVVGQKWGKKGPNAYLLAQKRARMSFTLTTQEIVKLHETHPVSQEILIEDKANGPAVIDTLKKEVPGIIPIEPDGSKLARAHAVTSYWEALNVWLPNPTLHPWVKVLISELTAFPAAKHDDQVDALTQALRRLYPLFSKLKINPAAIMNAMKRR